MIRNNKGFTLIESIIVISILSVILVLISSMLNYGIAEFNDANGYYTYKMNARYAMNRIVNEIKENYGATFSLGKVLASDASILVNSNKNDMNGNIQYYYEPNKYGVGDGYGELRRSNGDVIAKYIKDFTIVNEAANLVKVTVEGGRKNSEQTFIISTYVQLYN